MNYDDSYLDKDKYPVGINWSVCWSFYHSICIISIERVDALRLPPMIHTLVKSPLLEYGWIL